MNTLNFKTEFIGLLIMIRTRSRTQKELMKSFVGGFANSAASKLITGKTLMSPQNARDFLSMIIDQYRDNPKATYDVYGRFILLHSINLNFRIMGAGNMDKFSELEDLQAKQFGACMDLNFTPWYRFRRRRTFKNSLDTLQLQINNIKFN